MPEPRGGTRHAEEILNLYGAYFKCEAIFEKKCKEPECQKAKEATKEEKEKIKNAAKQAVIVLGAAGAAAAAPEVLPLLPAVWPQLEPVFQGVH